MEKKQQLKSTKCKTVYTNGLWYTVEMVVFVSEK